MQCNVRKCICKINAKHLYWNSPRWRLWCRQANQAQSFLSDTTKIIALATGKKTNHRLSYSYSYLYCCKFPQHYSFTGYYANFCTRTDMYERAGGKFRSCFADDLSDGLFIDADVWGIPTYLALIWGWGISYGNWQFKFMILIGMLINTACANTLNVELIANDSVILYLQHDYFTTPILC